jgi:hypothetical protein
MIKLNPMELVRKALKQRFNGVMPDSSIPIVATIEAEVKHFVRKNGLYIPVWEKLPTTQCMLDDLLTTAGRDMLHNATFMNGAQPAQLNYYGISSTSFVPAVGDLTLTGEITTPTHMIRHILTANWGGVTESYTHTASGNTSVMVASWENNTGAGSIIVYAYANFNAAAPGGTMGFESNLSSSVTLNSAAGAYDVLKLTVTLTLG